MYDRDIKSEFLKFYYYLGAFINSNHGHMTCINISEEGLFRVSGNRRVIDQLRLEYDQTGTANLSSVQDVSVVTSIFKMFFRELPDPLIPDQVL